MTHRPAAPQLLLRRRDLTGQPEAIRLRGGPVADGTSLHLGWDGTRLLTWQLDGVRAEYIDDAIAALMEIRHLVAAQQEKAAS